jgi:hypothetical protein
VVKIRRLIRFEAPVTADPICALRPELMIRKPAWLRSELGRNVVAGSTGFRSTRSAAHAARSGSDSS